MKTCPDCDKEVEESDEECPSCGHTFTDLFNPGAGSLGMNFEGEPTIGIGGGLSIDSEGDLNIGGIDLGGN